MDAIPAQLRKTLYLVLFVAGVVVGALNVADVNTGKAVDVIAYLGTALGLVAAGNVATKAGPKKVGQAYVELTLDGDQVKQGIEAHREPDE